MSPEFTILNAWKQFGVPGLIIAVLCLIVVSLAKRQFFKGDAKMQQESSAVTVALNVLQNQLQVNQDNNTRLFDILDRNTRSVEKMVEKLTEHGNELGAIKGQLSRIEGAVGR